MSQIPGLVTCVCITRNRRTWIPKMLACFEAQSYERRELLVISEGEGLFDLLPESQRTQVVHIQREPPFQVGVKRNFANDLAHGEFIAHWDDDDYSAPGRLADQVSRLQDTGLAVTGYRSLRFTDGGRSWMYTGAPGFVLGTSLCYRRSWWAEHPFNAKQIGEDTSFVACAQSLGQLAVAENSEMMYATIHGSNTSPRVLQGSNWKLLPI
jgi:glycosyltransferase involved in cell wall biosynthesis